MITLKNKYYTAEINPLGAEITQVVRNSDGRKYVWDDPDKKYWGRHAPILFPAIGKSNDDSYLIDGKKYSMNQHGFARDHFFEAVAQTDDNSVTLTQRATDETKKDYPFAYRLTVTYTLTDSGLTAAFEVANEDTLPKTQMPFALGFHPGFALSEPLEKYTLTLTNANLPLTKFGLGPVPFRSGDLKQIRAAKKNVLPLSHKLLDSGLFIIDAPSATAATLASTDGKYSVTLGIADFPYLTLWSPVKKNAPFVCVEPFAGLPDQAGDLVDWYHKLGNSVVESGESKRYQVSLALN